MSENRYLEDESINKSYYDEGISSKDLIIGSALLVGSTFAYKKGIFKPLIKEGLELSAEHKPLLSVLFNDTKRWLRSNEGVSKNSIFRQDIKTISKNIFSQDKEKAKEILNSTRDDFGLLKSMLNSSLDEIEKQSEKSLISSYANTSILNEAKRGVIEVNKYSDKNIQSKKTMQGKVYDSILKNFIKTDEELSSQLKTNGYRQLTLSDIAEINIIKDGSVKIDDKSSSFNIAKLTTKNDNNIPNNLLERILNFDVIDDTGQTFFKDKNTKLRLKDKYNINNLTFDDNLLINESGKILDLRLKHQQNIRAYHELSSEWKIPFINVNPLGLINNITGFDKYGKNSINFGTVTEDMVMPAITGKYGNNIENTISNVKKYDEKLKEVIEGVTIINGDVYTLGKSGSIKKLDYKYKKNISLIEKEKAHNAIGLSHLENSQRVMMGITNRHFEDFKPNDGDKYIKQKIANIFDIGRQEKDITKDKMNTMLEISNPDSYIEKFLSKVGLKITPYKNVNQDRNFTEMMHPGKQMYAYDTLFVTNKSINLKDLKLNRFNKTIVKDYFKQFVANFQKDNELVNNKTGALHFMSYRMNAALSSVGLGLSVSTVSGPISSINNLIAKRFLPIYGAYQGWNLLNAFTEGEDDNGQRTNLNRSIMETVSNLDIGAAYVRDKLGITNFTKKVTQLTPGYDQIEELPIITSLNFNQSSDERKEYWDYGKDPIRKSRYWSLNSSTSFTGGKIDYFKLNPLQASKSDAKFSDSQFGSRKEYFASIINPYHYDKKHYQDRPYLITSPAFENVPVFGPLLSSTIGKVLKPQIRMHDEYWNDDEVKTSKQIKEEQIIENIKEQRIISDNVYDLMTLNSNQAIQDVYKKTMFDSIDIKKEKSIQKASEMIFNVKAKLVKVSNSFNKLIGNEDENLTLEESTLDTVNYFTNKENSKSIHNYLIPVENTGKLDLNLFPEFIDSMIETSKTPFLSSNMYKDKDVFYPNSTLLSEEAMYSHKQMPISPNKKEYNAFYDKKSIDDRLAYNKPLEGQIKGDNVYESGAVLGEKIDLDKNVEFDTTYDLSNQKMVYKTGSGKFDIVSTGNEKDPLVHVNINNESADSIPYGGKKGVTLNNNYIVNKNTLDNYQEENIENPNGAISTIKNQISNTANVAGIYGFGFSSGITGEIQKGRTVIDTPSWSRSFNRSFWDESLGGLSGDLSEIFRRLVQKRITSGVNYYNPIRNTMPEWMPGDSGFINFQEGDPYIKVSRGEERLPGQGFERAYGINVDDYQVNSFDIGKSKEELISKFLKRYGIIDEQQQAVVRKDSKLNEKVKKYIERNNIAIDSDQTVYDKKNDIVGTYDFKVIDKTSKSGESILNIKSINNNEFQDIVRTKKSKDEDEKQVNFYLHNTNKKNLGRVLYVNNENPTEMYMTKFKYSKEMYNNTIDDINYARSEVKNAIASGQISRAERYNPIDKMRILADVAPYSNEYNEMNKYVRSLDLTDEQKKSVQYIEDMVTQQRKPLRTYEYRFKTSDVISKKVKIERQIDDDKFKTSEFDNPIKLAGIILPTKKDERYQKAIDFLNNEVKGNVKIKIAEDEHLRTNNDSLKTMNAVVYSNGVNINKELIKKGLADEKEDDYSAAGVHARFSPIQINFGKAWESIAHQNTIINNKILRVRSAKEDYERQQIYGRDFKNWTNPVKDFLQPMLWKSMADETTTDKIIGTIGGVAIGSYIGLGVGGKYSRVIGAGIGATLGMTTGTSIALAAFTGSLFGSSRFGKLIGASVGASTIIGTKLYKKGYETTTEQKWIPKEKRRENEVIEYLDKLEFVKNRRLYEVYAKKALKYDGIDVKNIIQKSEEEGAKTKKWTKRIENIKRQQKKSGKFNIKEYEEAGVKFDKNDKKYYFLRKDSGNENEKNELKRKKETIKNEEKKLKEKKRDILNDNSRLSDKDSEYIKNKKDVIKQKKKRLNEDTKQYTENSKNRKQKALEKTVNKRIDKAKNSKEIMMTSKNAMKAIEYYNKSESTMYGYDPGESISNFVKALPKKDKKYFNEFLKAGKKERKEILEIAPDYMKRALQSAYGLEIDKKESLTDYFSKHYLPAESWDGWQENYDFDAVKTKVISKEGFNLASHDIWQDDKDRADLYGPTKIPNIDREESIQAVTNQLKSVLGSAGYENLEINVTHGHSSPSINLNLYESRKEKFEEKMRERLGVIN